MSNLKFDPEAYKMPNCYGGYEPNEKGLFQYPKKPLSITEPSCRQRIEQLPVSSYICCSVGGALKEITTKNKFNSKNAEKHFKTSVYDPMESHYRVFLEDPALPSKTLSPSSNLDEFKISISPSPSEKDLDKKDKSLNSEDANASQFDIKRLSVRNKTSSSKEGKPKIPIDPIHWKPDLFDTKYEKYYLRNLMIEDPYRQFLTSCYDPSTTPYHISEYMQNFSGNHVLTTSSSGRIYGISKPTDIPDPCHWKRYRTQKLRDVIFTKEKDSIDSHLDYNDPKRYNPWPRLKLSYDQMLGDNYRPRPRSGVEYSQTTLLPAVSPYSKLWIV